MNTHSLPSPRRLQRCHILAGGLAAVTGIQLAGGVLSGGSYSLVGGPGGGGTSTGGGFTITGWAASAGAGVSKGDAFELACGLIGVYAVQTAEIVLQVQPLDGNQTRLWWAPDVTGFRLEFTSMVGPGAVWQAVTPAPTNNEFTTATDQPARFFRLQK